MPEDLVATEAPAVDTGFEPTADAIGAETPQEPEGGAEPSVAAGREKAAEGAPEPLKGPPIVDGRLNPAIKPVLEKLKAENPAAERAIREALFRESRLAQALPGGLKELQTLRQHVEELGGPEGIEEITKEIGDWRAFDEKYTAGDPEILKFFTDTPEAAAGFLKIAPAAFEKFRELNPEGYGAYVAQVFQSDMMQEKIPLLIERLADFLPQDKPEALKIWQSLAAYVNRIGTLAGKPVTPPAAKPNEQDNARSKELETREANLRRQEWREGTNATHRQIYQAEWQKQIGERRLTAEQRATVTELYGLKLGQILKHIQGFNDKLNRYFSGDQRDGFQRYHESVFRDAVPRALRTAIAQAGIGPKPGPKPGESAAAAHAAPPKPGERSGGKPAPSAGFQMINKKPDIHTEVDRVQTTTDMLVAGRAVLKDGRKVSWRV